MEKFLGIVPLLDLQKPQEVLVISHARQLGCSSASLYRWLRHHRKFGFSGLADKPRSDAGSSWAFRNRWRAMVIVAEMYAEGKPVCAIHRAVVEVWPSLYPDRKPPVYNTVARYIRSIFPPKGKP
jgi:transposase-like protein